MEIITVNDGSTDNSLEILTSYASKDQRIKIISQEYMGVAASRNTGIGISTGEYLGFVDSDDYIDLNFYENLYKTLKKANADYVMGMTKRFRVQSETYRILPPYHAITTSSFSEKISLLRGGGVCDKLYKTSIIKSHNLSFDTGYTYEGNIFLVQYAFYSEIFSMTCDTFYNYFCNDDGICRSKNHVNLKKNEESRIFALDHVMRISKENNFDNQALREVKKLLLVSVLDNNATKRKHRAHIYKQIGIFNIIKLKLYKRFKIIAQNLGRKYYIDL